MKNLSPALAVLLGLLALAARAAPEGWQPVTSELVAQEKPGYGGVCGVAVDPENGELFLDLSDRGIYRSLDQGKTWRRHSETPLKGRTETPGCLQLDPTRKSSRLLVPTVYGGPVALGVKETTAWQFMDGKASHVDWCALDWTRDDPKFVLALKHESRGMLLRSRDGGKTFDEIGKGFGPAFVFDNDTAVAAAVKGPEHPAGGLLRTTDGAVTFQSVGSYSPVALPRWHGNTLYWLVEGALIRTRDKGATWTRVCDLKDGRCGPVFGKTAREMFVLSRSGVVASTDGGATWAAPIPVPELKGVAPLSWLDYDPVNEVLYVMKMGSDLFKMPHRKAG
jgi:photosystem II stability/assembly factor-like uncharacterized protein